MEKKLVLIALLALVGCADSKWPTSFTGETPDAVLQAPRVVQATPEEQDATFPNLATVPPKPAGYLSAKEQQQQIEQLTAAQREADAIRARLSLEEGNSNP